MTAPHGHRFWGGGRVLGVAHRGASRYAPENTLPAFALAIEQGARAVECDAQRTRDGRVVVIHDQAVNRTTDGRGPVGDLTLDEVLRLDAGAWFGPAFAGTRIPLLDEVLDLVRGRVLLKVEIKNAPRFYDGIEAQILDAVRRRDMEDDVLLMSFDHESVRETRRLSPRSPTGIIYSARLVDAPGAARAAGADALCVNWQYVTAGVVAAAREAGLRVFVWTVDDEEAARRLAALGVDGVTSNDPVMLERVLRPR